MPRRLNHVLVYSKNLSGNLALQELAGPVKNLKPVLVKCLQFQIQSQLQRELIGCQRLVRQGRVSLSRKILSKIKFIIRNLSVKVIFGNGPVPVVGSTPECFSSSMIVFYGQRQK